MQNWSAEEIEILKKVYQQGNLKKYQPKIPLALADGMNGEM